MMASWWSCSCIRSRAQRNGANDDTDDISPIAAQIELSIALIQELRRHVEAAGARFMMVEIPRWLDRQTFKSSFAALPATLTGDPAFISPPSAFGVAAGPQAKIYAERGHHHLTALGHQLLADLLAQRIELGPWAAKCKVRNHVN
jgi:hypothetical protein